MKSIKLIGSIFIITLLFNACRKDDDPIKISKLGFIKTAILNDENNDDFAQIGETIAYTFSITNTGDYTINNIMIDDERIGVENLSLNPASLTPGQTASISVDYVITFSDSEEGSITNQATVTGEDSEGETVTDLSDNDSNDEDDETMTTFVVNNGAYENGFFVVNEGNIGSGNASLTFVSDDYASVEQKVFSTVNGRALGDTAQSIFMTNDTAYIVLNVSNTIEVVNRYTMESITTISGSEIANPRYMVAYNGFGYISNWGEGASPDDDTIVIVDLDTNTITGTISVGEGPEEMVVKNSKIYVNLQGGWSENNKVVVIDTATNTVEETIEVGDVPNSITLDSNGDIWVLCGGKPYYADVETPGKLHKLNGNSIALTKDFTGIQHPNHLSINGTDFYYNMDSKVYKWDGVATTLPVTEESGLDGSYYGMTSNNGMLYALDAKDYASEGTLKVFDLSNSTETQSITTGIIPNGVAFN